tara:strand:- start:4304 stop:4810 length:507 start_codon:yes stop_codon:yes gene_type:complete
MESEKNSLIWLVVYTKPNHEKKVSSEVEKVGFKTYLPLVRKKREWSDRSKWIDFPFFPSYLFVKCKINELLNIIKIPGIVKVIKFGGEIAIVKDSTISSLKIMLNGSYFPKHESYYLSGDQVKIEHGPLKGFEGEVIRSSGSNRLLLKIGAIKHSISIHVKKSHLKKY